MATAPHTNLLDQAFLTRQRAALDAERRAEARMADALGAETNNLVRGRQAAGVTAEGFGKGETASIDLQQARAEVGLAIDEQERGDGARLRRAAEAGSAGLIQPRPGDDGSWPGPGPA